VYCFFVVKDISIFKFLSKETVADFMLFKWRKVISSGVTVGIMAGERSGDAFYVKGTIEQARILGCERIVSKGHHLAHEVEPEDFMVGFLEMIRRLKAKKKKEGNA